MSKKQILFIGLIVSLPFLAAGHGYWLETEGSGKIGDEVKVKLVYGEYASEKLENGARLDKMADIVVSITLPSGEKQALKMTQLHTHWEGKFIPKEAGIYQITGINDAREVQDWHKHKLGITRPIQYVRTHYTIGGVEGVVAKTPQFLDIIPSFQGEFMALTAYLKGKPFPAASIKIINPHTWEKKLITNERGKVTFYPPTSGMYLAEVEWIDETPGSFKGKEYETVRHKSETTIFYKNLENVTQNQNK